MNFVISCNVEVQEIDNETQRNFFVQNFCEDKTVHYKNDEKTYVISLLLNNDSSSYFIPEGLCIESMLPSMLWVFLYQF